MSVDIWFPQDLARVIAAAHEAMRASTEDVSSEQMPVYQKGYVDALRVISVSLGLASAPPHPRPASPCLPTERRLPRGRRT